MLTFSVVVPTYNRSRLLAQVLDAIARQVYERYEVIVVDDESTDDTRELVTARYPQCRFVHSNHGGPAAARNLGIAAATGDVVAFTDDDVVVPVEWLSRLADGYERYPSVVGVGGYQEAETSVLAQSVFAQYEQWLAQRAGVGSHEVVDGWNCPAGGTNNMSYRVNVLREVGGFDERFRFAAGEDADLKWRLTQRGYKLLFVPVRAVHLQVYNRRTFSRQAKTRGRGRYVFRAIHGDGPRSKWRILAAGIYQAASALIRAPTLPDPRYGLLGVLEAYHMGRGEWTLV